MKKKNLKTIATSLLLSCALLVSPLPAQAAATQPAAKPAASVTASGTTATAKPAASTGKWKTVKGYHYYYNAKGKKVTGKVKIGSRYYFFDKKGIQRYGWKKIGSNYYYFRMNNSAKGAYMITSTKVNGIVLDSQGRARKSGSNGRKLKIMVEANRIVEKITKPSMTKTQRLRTCFNYVKKHYSYYCWRDFKNTANWEKDFAEDMFFRGGRGDCVSYAAAFAYLANAVGMKKVYVICSGGHGWAEIGGKVYDPDWALVSKVDSYFAMSYNLSGVNGRPMYKGNRLYAKKI
ncbi:transglutaminase domain-containing protein [Blautia sp. HCP3S3_H10_1]|uniref:transglutaminase domain-containing protein n=1 Tax=unclassified Blautia TaxID=2648079 RepID=UPI003F90F03F|nr:transglutaminase domain-containing protein [Clostridia bacterium]